MVKTKGPLMSLEAHGSLAKTLNYSQRQSGSQCRRHNKPTGVASPKQRAQRRLTEFLVTQWQNMSDGDKGIWTDAASAAGVNLSGYHYFLQKAQGNLYRHHGLAGYWHCNEIVDGKVLDLSGNANHGTLKRTFPADAPTLVPSRSPRLSNALLFNGTTDYVEMAPLDITKWNKITVACWMNFATWDETDIAISIMHSSSDDIRLLINSGNLNFTLDDGTTLMATMPIDISFQNKFLQVIGTFDGSLAKLYVDGVLEDEIGGSFDFAGASGEMNIGRRAVGGFEFGGIIDETCIYNRALSAAEIKTRYNFATRKI